MAWEELGPSSLEDSDDDLDYDDYCDDNVAEDDHSGHVDDDGDQGWEGACEDRSYIRHGEQRCKVTAGPRFADVEVGMEAGRRRDMSADCGPGHCVLYKRPREHRPPRRT